jgi:hypothetical protein
LFILRKVDDRSARSLIMEPVGSEFRRNDLYGLGRSLDREGEPTPEGAQVPWIADILTVANPITWKGALAGASDDVSKTPFAPMWTRSDGATAHRSFDIGDLPAGAELPLRALAKASRNEAVRSRIFHVLWCRFHNDQSDAARAIDAHLALAKNVNGFDAWPTMEHSLGHSAMLIGARKDLGRLRELLATFDFCGARVLEWPRRFPFERLADTLLATVLSSKWASKLIGPDQTARWAGTLGLLAIHLNANGQRHFADEALGVLEVMCARTGKSAYQREVQRWRVDEKIATALAASAGLKPSWLQEALEMAGNYGFKALVDECRRQLPQAILQASKQMQGVPVKVDFPGEWVASIDEIITLEPSWPKAVRALVHLPHIISPPAVQLAAVAEQRLKANPTLAIIGSTHYRDGKISFEAYEPDEKKRESLALTMSAHLSIVETLLGHFLASTHERCTAEGLLQAMEGRDLLDERHLPFLQASSERFFKKDWVSSGVLVLTRYEGIVRDFVRAGGYHALKADGGSAVLMDETLNSLLRAPDVRALLGQDHAAWVEFLLCDPELGPNLRNEVAHGNLEASSLTPPRVLLLWLLVLRLTFSRVAVDP